MQKRGLGGNLSLFLADVVVGRGGTVADAAHSSDRAAAEQHGFCEDRFSGRGVPGDGEIADVRGGRRHHMLQPCNRSVTGASPGSPEARPNDPAAAGQMTDDKFCRAILSFVICYL
jgi:hypothetical protein